MGYRDIKISAKFLKIEVTKQPKWLTIGTKIVQICKEKVKKNDYDILKSVKNGQIWPKLVNQGYK